MALLTRSCTVCARPRDISLAPPAESQAPSPQSRCTANRANSTAWSEINQRGSQRAECCTNTDICEVLSAFKASLVPCCEQELTKSEECDVFFSYLNLQFVINSQSRVLQGLNDGGVGVGQLSVFSHQGYRDALQETIRTVKKKHSSQQSPHAAVLSNSNTWFAFVLMHFAVYMIHFLTGQTSLSTWRASVSGSSPPAG